MAATIGSAMIPMTQPVVAHAADIKVLSTNAFRSVIAELGPQFERATGHKLAIKFVGGPDLVKRQINSGEAFDVAISISGVIDDLIKNGKIAPATRADVARTGIGVAVRAGVPKPDVSSVDAFKRTLLNAKSVAYATEGRSGAHFLTLLEQFSIAEEMKPKLKALTTATSNEAVAKGEVEIAALLISAIVSASGVELAGPLPSGLQSYLRFTAGARNDATPPEAANALIAFLTSPVAIPVIKAKGMEPATP